MVTIAGSAARTACRSTTRRGKPHISAYWTNSDDSARLTIVCVIFKIGPALMIPSVSTGKTRCPNDEDKRFEIAGKKTVDDEAAGDGLRRHDRHVDAAERRRDPAELRVEDVDEHQRQPEVRHGSGKQTVVIGKFADRTGAKARRRRRRGESR